VKTRNDIPWQVRAGDVAHMNLCIGIRPGNGNQNVFGHFSLQSGLCTGKEKGCPRLDSLFELCIVSQNSPYRAVQARRIWRISEPMVIMTTEETGKTYIAQL
jgi:hypothetical protein